MYEFSIPMPYSKEQADKLIKLNNEIQKSKITSLYFGLPSSNELFTGFEQRRNFLLKETRFDFWQELIKYYIDKGFEIIYCLNSPRAIPIESSDFPIMKERLDKLLQKFIDLKVKKLRVANPRLLFYINKNYPYFDLYGSTASDYKIIQEFQNLKQIHPYLKQIVPSHNANKNFTLLKNIKKLGFDVEIMVNEGCITGCSNRLEHESVFIDNNYENFDKNNDFSISFCKFHCSKLQKENPIFYITCANHIYPWEIEEYSKIGINKFKLNGRDSLHDYYDSSYVVNMYGKYLRGIESFKKTEDVEIADFVWNFACKRELKNLKVKDVKHLLPDIKYFAKKGDLCSSYCGIKCRYCYKCAEKIQKVFWAKQNTNRRQPVLACKITK